MSNFFFFNEGPQPSLWAVSRAAPVKITKTGVPNRLHYRVLCINIIYRYDGGLYTPGLELCRITGLLLQCQYVTREKCILKVVSNNTVYPFMRFCSWL